MITWRAGMNVLALADDMTGALEVGAKFSAAGFEVIVSAQPLPAGSAPVVVLDTETRHLDPEAAFERVVRFVSASGAQRPQLIYKKTDSTLRGNIQSELRALSYVFPDWRIGYAPAYPAMGRTVKAGVLYVHGVIVSETEFARDELNPVRSGSISALVDERSDCLVFDGETDEHLADAARVILSDGRMRIAAGPAALAECIADAIEWPKREPPRHPLIRTCLILNGSRHDRSARQVYACAAGGWDVLDNTHEAGVSATDAAARNARHLIRRTVLDAPDAVLVIGGDTAFAVVRELGFPTLLPISEIVTGVPVTKIAVESLRETLPSRGRDLILITKAGGFGEDDVLTRVQSQLSNGQPACAE